MVMALIKEFFFTKNLALPSARAWRTRQRFFKKNKFWLCRVLGPGALGKEYN
jgi:hypothetical protein